MRLSQSQSVKSVIVEQSTVSVTFSVQYLRHKLNVTNFVYMKTTKPIEIEIVHTLRAVQRGYKLGVFGFRHFRPPHTKHTTKFT